MNKSKLTKGERAIDDALARGEYKPASRADFSRVAKAIARHRKDAILHIRINSRDLAGLKRKAKELGVPYQSFVCELLHRYIA